MEQQINVNLLALMKITQDFLPRILRQKKGHIVNVASQAGTFSVPYGASYAASKHGVVGFTKAIRNEFRTKGDISVGVILPGYITRTGMYDDMIKSSDTIENLDEYKFIVVKNPMNYKNSFSHIKNIFVLDTLGPTPPTCKNLKFKKIKKYYPKYEDLKFIDVLTKHHN